jgi:hypothetical protein
MTKPNSRRPKAQYLHGPAEITDSNTFLDFNGRYLLCPHCGEGDMRYYPEHVSLDGDGISIASECGACLGTATLDIASPKGQITMRWRHPRDGRVTYD